MKAEDYLGQAFCLDQRIHSAMKELEDMKEMVSSLSSPGFDEKVMKSPSGEAPFVKALERFWDMEEEVDEEIDTLLRLKRQIRNVIAHVEDPNYQMVLRYKYIHNYNWEQIGTKMFVDRTTAKRWHDTAMKKVTLPDEPIII